MLEIIKRTGVFLIMAETLYQFVQENRYARYVRMLIRLMTLAILILPVLELFKEGSSALFYEKLNAMEAGYMAYEEGVSGTENDKKNMEEKIASYDADLEIASYASTDIKTSCNKCAMENGYQITDVLITKNGIFFSLQLLQEEIVVPQVEMVTVQAGMSEESQSTEKVADENAQEEQRMQEVLADYLGIADTLIEVRIYG